MPRLALAAALVVVLAAGGCESALLRPSLVRPAFYSGRTAVTGRALHRRAVSHAPSRTRAHVSLAEDAEKPAADEGAAPGISSLAMVGVIFNMMIGTGIYCLPASASGVALPAKLGLVGGLGAGGAITFALIGLFCARTGARSLDELWTRAGPPLNLPRQLPQILITIYTVGVITQLQIALGNLLAPVMPLGPESALGGALAHVPWLAADPKRFAVLATAPFLLSALLTWRDIASLAPSSAAGVLAKFASAAIVVLRAVDGTYVEGGAYFADSAAALAATASTALPAVTGSSVLRLLGAMSTAYMCHVDVPRYFRELRDTGPLKFSMVTFAAFSVASACYGVIMLATHVLFGDAVTPFALNAFAAADPLGRVAQLATAFGVVVSYLLIVIALKGVLSSGVLGASIGRALVGEEQPGDVPAERARAIDTRLTLLLFGATTGLGLFAASHLLFVVAIRGALLGTTITYILPAAIGLGLDRARAAGLGWGAQSPSAVADASALSGTDAAVGGEFGGTGGSLVERAGLCVLLVAGTVAMVLATSQVLRQFAA